MQIYNHMYTTIYKYIPTHINRKEKDLRSLESVSLHVTAFPLRISCYYSLICQAFITSLCTPWHTCGGQRTVCRIVLILPHGSWGWNSWAGFVARAFTWANSISPENYIFSWYNYLVLKLKIEFKNINFCLKIMDQTVSNGGNSLCLLSFTLSIPFY